MSHVRPIIVIEHDRGGGASLSSLVPDVARLVVGAGDASGAAINPWDVRDAAHVAPQKIAYLVRLHALLIGEHGSGGHRLGLGELERTLLAIAIRDVYARAADGEGVPGESLLREVLADLARQERADPRGSERHAATYAHLGARLLDVCAGGRFGHLFDGPTRAEIEPAPLVVFDVAAVPDAVAAAMLLAIAEFVTQRPDWPCADHVALRAGAGEPPVVAGEDAPLPLAFAPESLLNGLHEAYTRRRMTSGETRAIAYLHAISDVAHFLHPPTALPVKRPEVPP